VTESATPAIAGSGLLHPIPLAFVALLVANDHYFKHAWPGVITGKLSDVAGLAFFPLFLQAGWEWIGPRPPGWRPSRRVLVRAAIATAIVFTLVKSWQPATEVYAFGLAALQWPARAIGALVHGRGVPSVARVSIVRDITDLLALPAIAVALACGWRRTAQRPE
jgi:hypothetical protein